VKSGRLDILLIDDDDHDIFFVQKAMERAGKGDTVHAVHDGEEAIRYLRGEGKYADRIKFPLPNVILTDLKMPRMDGFEFLRWVRSHPECSIIPTIVYSSSGHEKDVKEAYRLGTNAYMVKPTDLNEMVETLRTMYDYWSRCECAPIAGNC
jgi:CheY-like chemotaxis protein